MMELFTRRKRDKIIRLINKRITFEKLDELMGDLGWSTTTTYSEAKQWSVIEYNRAGKRCIVEIFPHSLNMTTEGEIDSFVIYNIIYV